MVLSASADGINPLIYEYTNPETTVEFSNPLGISEERQQEIADNLAGKIPNMLNLPDPSSPENIICTLFGHNLAPEVTVTVTRHKVSKYQPRCLLEVYHVTYCTRCDYTQEELDNSFYIFCCPED